MKIQTVILLFLTNSFCTVVMAHDMTPDEEYRNFFDRYRDLQRNFDTDITELIADNAKIIATIEKNDGTLKSIKFIGAEYKKIIIKNNTKLREKGSPDEYSKISLSVTDSGATINANRYSRPQCFNDTNYRMLLKRSSVNDIKIVEMSGNIPETSMCNEKYDEFVGVYENYWERRMHFVRISKNGDGYLIRYGKFNPAPLEVTDTGLKYNGALLALSKDKKTLHVGRGKFPRVTDEYEKEVALAIKTRKQHCDNLDAEAKRKSKEIKDKDTWNRYVDDLQKRRPKGCWLVNDGKRW